MSNAGPETLDAALDMIWSDVPQWMIPLRRSPAPLLPFSVRLGEHGTIIQTDYPGSHRILPELHLAAPCDACRSRTVYVDESGSHCVKCDSGWRA